MRYEFSKNLLAWNKLVPSAKTITKAHSNLVSLIMRNEAIINSNKSINLSLSFL